MGDRFVFEALFMVMQIIRHGLEAYYLLTDKAEDATFRNIVGFGDLVVVLWSVIHLAELGKERFVPEG